MAAIFAVVALPRFDVGADLANTRRIHPSSEESLLELRADSSIKRDPRKEDMSGTESSETTGLQLVDLSLRVSHLSRSTITHIVCFVFIQGESPLFSWVHAHRSLCCNAHDFTGITAEPYLLLLLPRAFFDAPAVFTQIGVTQTRRRANEYARAPNLHIYIIYKAQYRYLSPLP